ncbi:MAG: hypothetical protein V1489_00770 [Candidatus Liptonbacteria bacterium]
MGKIFFLITIGALIGGTAFGADVTLYNSDAMRYAAQAAARSGTNTGSVSPGQMVLDIYNFSLIAGGLLAFGAIVYGAIMYGLSGGNTSLAHDAKDQITQAIVGLILLFGAYMLLNIINPGMVSLNIPKLEPLTVSSDTNSCPPGQIVITNSNGTRSCQPDNRPASPCDPFGHPNNGCPSYQARCVTNDACPPPLANCPLYKCSP